MARLRQRQKEEIIRKTLARISPASGGSAPPSSNPPGVGTYNGRSGNVTSVIGDIVQHASTHNAGGTDALAIDAAAATGSLRTLGASAQQAVPGNDARLSDARTPLAHHATHESGGSDQVTLTEAQITNLVADLAARVLSTDSRLSDVRPGKYDVGTLVLATDQFLIQDRHLYLTGAERLTLPGTAEVLLTDLGNTAGYCIGTPKTPQLSFTVMTEYFLEVFQRLNLVKQMRATLQGTADMILNDNFQSRSRIVLAGVG